MTTNVGWSFKPLIHTTDAEWMGSREPNVWLVSCFSHFCPLLTHSFLQWKDRLPVAMVSVLHFSVTSSSVFDPISNPKWYVVFLLAPAESFTLLVIYPTTAAEKAGVVEHDLRRLRLLDAEFGMFQEMTIELIARTAETWSNRMPSLAFGYWSRIGLMGAARGAWLLLSISLMVVAVTMVKRFADLLLCNECACFVGLPRQYLTAEANREVLGCHDTDLLVLRNPHDKAWVLLDKAPELFGFARHQDDNP